jgi:membrane protein implicated in regulation of membrane protease activity
MLKKGNRFTSQDLGAYGMGLAVTVVSALLTAPVLPIPIDLLISLGLGGTAWYAAHKLLDPWTDSEREEQLTLRGYKVTLAEIAEVAGRIKEAGSKWRVGANVARRLGSIVSMIEMILDRYRNRRDFAGAAQTLVVLNKFDELLAHYVKVRCNELFIDKDQAKKEIAETEGQVIPMVERALEELGRKIDLGESTEIDIHKGTLEDMLSSLDLVRSLREQMDPQRTKEDSNDA